MHPRSRPVVFLAALACISVLLRAILSAQAIENLYSRGLFPLLRYGLDFTLGLLPFPLFWLFWLGIVWLLLREIYVIRRRRRAGASALRTLSYSLLGLAQLALTLVVLFLWIWGFNYGRQAVEERMGFTLYEPSLEELRQRVYTTGDLLGRLRRDITQDTLALPADLFPTSVEDAVRPLVTTALLRQAYPAPGRPRGWRLLPRGVLLRLGTAGVYWPWASQGNIDAGLHHLQQPAVMAHELAHAYGFGDEGTCSFWAQLAARETEDPVLRYALELAYWRNIAGLLRYADPEGYLRWRRESLDPGIRNDLAAIYANGERYTDIAPSLRDATYTAYLHAQGISEGLLNYGRVVRLVEGYRRRE